MCSTWLKILKNMDLSGNVVHQMLCLSSLSSLSPWKRTLFSFEYVGGWTHFWRNDTPTLHFVGLVFSSNPCTAGCPLLLHVATALGSLGQVPHASKDATAPGEVRCHVTLLGRGWGAVGFGDQFRTLPWNHSSKAPGCPVAWPSGPKRMLLPSNEGSRVVGKKLGK